MDGIAEAHPLRLGNILIPRRLPELEEIDLDIDVWFGERCVFQVLLDVVSQLRLGRLLFKLACAVQNGDLLVLSLALYRHDLLRQFIKRTVL